jgi:CHASE3 domain sensor protein
LKTLSSNLIRIAVAAITGLLVIDFILTSKNTRIIEENRLLQHQAEQIKVTTSQFAIIIIHNLDLGLRSYALFEDEKYLYPLHIAVKQKDSLLLSMEQALKNQRYPLDEFYILKDSINSYADLNLKWLDLFQNKQLEEFKRLADQDRGYHLWLQYEKFAERVYAFEDEIVREAQRQYREASRNNRLIRIVLFFISVPTLLITAYHSNKKFAIQEQLRKAEEEKALYLLMQKEKLEQAVDERTKEIQDINRLLQQQHNEISAQNEEITAQNEEITTQNDELNRHREELAAQNQALLESKKQQLDMYSHNLIEKSEIISRLSDEIESLKANHATDQEQVKNFSKVLNSTILTEEDWEKFKKTFEEVYPNFFGSLRYKFPDVTASELRLSALIKLNLSLKEASNTLGISSESVKKSRYRLKKKIALTEEESLEEFIRNL